MVVALVAVAALLGSQLGGSSAAVLPSGTVWATLALICVFVLGAPDLCKAQSAVVAACARRKGACMHRLGLLLRATNPTQPNPPFFLPPTTHVHQPTLGLGGPCPGSFPQKSK